MRFSNVFAMWVCLAMSLNSFWMIEPSPATSFERECDKSTCIVSCAFFLLFTLNKLKSQKEMGNWCCCNKLKTRLFSHYICSKRTVHYTNNARKCVYVNCQSLYHLFVSRNCAKYTISPFQWWRMLFSILWKMRKRVFA